MSSQQTSERPETESDKEVAISQPIRVVLIRHGRPALPIAPRTSHRGFRDYIDAYEEAGLDTNDAPPEELRDLLVELDAIFTSERRRAHESAKVLAPNAELVIDPLFAEAQLAGPPIPLVRMRVAKWAVVARILWYVGYHPGIEDYRKAKHRASEATDILLNRAKTDGLVALVAHGYFNYLIGRELNRRGFRKFGTHRARFWNAVLYHKQIT
jgi:broad specificity phosphatase PhoE